MKKTLLAAAFILFAGATGAVEMGKPAPDFSVQDISGHAQSLGAYKGKVIVLEWNNPGCPFVHKHYDTGNMQKLQAYAKGKGVVWLTVNSGAAGMEGNETSAEAAAQVKAVGGHETAYILDPHGTLGHLYGAKATPHMFVIGKDQALVYAGAIDNKPTTDHADVKDADNYVRDAIDATLAGKAVAVSSTRAYGCSVKY